MGVVNCFVFNLPYFTDVTQIFTCHSFALNIEKWSFLDIFLQVRNELIIAETETGIIHTFFHKCEIYFNNTLYKRSNTRSSGLTLLLCGCFRLI